MSTPLPLSPEDLSHASKLFGQSLFSAIQLAKEQEARRALTHHYPGTEGDVLKIPIPEHLMTPLKTAADAASGMFARAMQQHTQPMRIFTNAQQGFGDAKRNFFHQEKARIDEELRAAQQEYIDTLSTIKQGEEATPCVDAFCSGIASAVLFDKEAQAVFEGPDISDGSIKRFGKNIAGKLLSPLRPVGDAAVSSLMDTAAGAAYLTYLAKQQAEHKQDAYMYEQQPTRVELEPYRHRA